MVDTSKIEVGDTVMVKLVVKELPSGNNFKRLECHGMNNGALHRNYIHPDDIAEIIPKPFTVAVGDQFATLSRTATATVMAIIDDHAMVRWTDGSYGAYSFALLKLWKRVTP